MRTCKVLPIVTSAHFCEDVMVDGQGRITLVGLFNRLASQMFPFVSNKLCLFISLSDGRGAALLDVSLRHEESNQVIWSEKNEIVWKDPSEPAIYIRTITGLPFPSPGNYSLDLKLNDDLLATRGLRVVQVGAGTNVQA